MTTHSSTSQSYVANGQYRTGRKIGEGSFGVVLEGTAVATGNSVAIKFEPRKSDAPQLRDEYRSYRALAGTPGIPQVYHFGVDGLYNVLVMDLLGINLEDLFDICGRKFSVKTVCMLAKQMLSRVQSIHEKFLIYRDIKPDNFLIGCPGTKTASLVHVVDFGMAKHYRDPKTKMHIPYRERKSLSGTARYMSINTHLGREQSRRDDLESLGHVFLYFLRGSLPWQGLKAATNRQKYERIGEKKQSTPIAELCEGFPEEFAIYMNYVRKLGFEENPDYDFLRELFSKVLLANGDQDDSIYDWALIHGGKGWDGTPPPNAGSAQNKPQRDRDRERERQRERTSHQALAPTTPNHHTRSPTQGTGDAMPSPLVLPPAPALVQNSQRERDRRAAAASASNAPSPMAARRASGQHLPATHPYAATTAVVHSQLPSAYRPSPTVQPADPFAYGTVGRSRDASNVALAGSPMPPAMNEHMRRTMTPNMNRQHSLDRRDMDDARQQRAMEQDQERSGFLCCR